MTKYILQSGGIKNNPEAARRYAAEMVKEQGDEPKILICLFAQPRENWEQKFAADRGSFQEWFPQGITPAFQMALPANFAEQVAWCDILCVRGGDNDLLKYWFDTLNAPNTWKGKVYAGSSAGGIYLSTYSWSCDWRACVDGGGILPIKFIPHFKSSRYAINDPRGEIQWDDAFAELHRYKDSTLPVYALEEGSYEIFEVDE